MKSVAPIVPRYRLSLHIPVRSWHKIQAWYLDFPEYRRRVCLCGVGALTMLLVNFPVIGFGGRAYVERGNS